MLLVRRRSRARRPRRSARAGSARPAAPAGPPCTSACPTQRAPARSTSSSRRERRRLAGEVGVDALLPAVRSLRAQPQPLGACGGSRRLEVRGLEQHLGRPRRRPRVSSPPMIPASATARSASAITRSSGSSARSAPSSVRSVSPGARAADDDRPPRERGRSRTRAAGCRARASRSSSRRRRSRSGACPRRASRALSQSGDGADRRRRGRAAPM